MVRDELSVLAAFLAVADARSFTKAARQLGVSPSALSHAIRGLEDEIGVRLLSRTTRSVAPTEAGLSFITRLRPALADIRGALDDVVGQRQRAAGRVRLIASPLAATMVLAPKLGAFARKYPDVLLDITTSNESRFDLVAGGYDAGIHLGEFIERDMVAVKVSPEQRAAIVASPKYFKAHPAPVTPRDLTNHRCLNFRHESETAYRWEFEKGDQTLTVAVHGPLVVDNVDLLIQAAVDGAGLAFMLESQAEPHLRKRALTRVLEDWCPPFAGYFLYYPSRRQQTAALSAVIEMLRKAD